MQKKDNSELYIFIIGIIPIIWVGLLIAPISDGGIMQIISKFSEVTSNPFRIVICGNTLKCVLLFKRACSKKKCSLLFIQTITAHQSINSEK